MYPPKASDDTIRRVIRDLTADGKLPSGAAVRAFLAERYSTRGGVARIYRLLRAEGAQVVRDAPSRIEARLLEQELKNLREHLAEQRQREAGQQAYWAGKISAVLSQVEALELKIQASVMDGATAHELRAAVQAAGVRAGQLEVLLREFGPVAKAGADADGG